MKSEVKCRESGWGLENLRKLSKTSVRNGSRSEKLEKTEKNVNKVIERG